MYYGMDTQKAGKNVGKALAKAMKKFRGAGLLVVIGKGKKQCLSRRYNKLLKRSF